MILSNMARINEGSRAAALTAKTTYVLYDSPQHDLASLAKLGIVG